jgi:Zn-dependent peptidase ImmA (M78 family)/transcriptional regulator with XRE-family HTH domain
VNQLANPEMLIVARESRGFTQTELASRASVPQSSISKFENGILELTGERLASIAAALDYPVHFFFRSDHIYGFRSPCFYHRKRVTLPIHKLKEIQARMNILRIQAMSILQGVEIETVNGFQRLDTDDYGPPERIAALVRANWHLPMGPVRNLVHAVEAAGGLVVRASLGTRKLDAVSHWAVGQRPLFFLNDDLPDERLRFTLAHEIGHIVMHATTTPDQEDEADRFAAEFLMPAQEIRPDLHNLTLPRARELKPYWRVSMAAIIKRGYDLEQITNRQYRRLFMRLGQLGYRINEPGQLPREEPSVLNEAIHVHLRDHGYSVNELARSAGVHEHEFRMLFLPEEGQRLKLVSA